MDPVKKLQEAVDESIKLQKQMLDPEEGLEARIKTLEAEGKGAADLKEQVNKMAEDNAKAIDEINTQTEAIKTSLDERQDEFEAKFSKGAPGGRVDPLSGFEKAVKSLEIPAQASDEQIHAAIGKQGKSFPIKNASEWVGRKTVTSLAASGGDTIVPQYESTIIAPGQEPITLLDVLPRSPISGPIVWYMYEVLGSRTNGAAIQSLDFTGTGQGGSLGDSDFVFNQLSEQTRTFGHEADLAAQIVADVPQLRGYVDGQMRYMVRFDLEDQLVNGDNTSTNLNGLKNRATAYDTDLDTDVGVEAIQNMDVLRLAAHQCTLTWFPATFFLLHPLEATGLELIKDANENYMMVNPAMGNAIRPWGVPVVSTTQQTAGDFTAAAGNHIEVMVRQDLVVEASTEHSSNFTNLLVTLRCYGRFGCKFYQPGSIIDGDFSSAKA